MPKTATKPDPTVPISSVTFRDPPVPPKYDWPAIAAQLRERPGEWALVFKAGNASRVNAVRDGRIAAVHPDLGFEMTTVNNTRQSPRTCDLYLRFNPEKVKA